MSPTSEEFPSCGESDPAPDTAGERVVISGMAGLYPESHNVKELSDILYNKINPINNDNSRWTFDHPEVSHHTGKVPTLQNFDAQFFKIFHRLSDNMDPMARKLLEQTYHAIYDAGICIEDIYGKHIGVFIGNALSESEKMTIYRKDEMTGIGLTAGSKAMFSNRISYWLNVKGPSMTIDMEACSSTQALEQAFLAIKRGECEAAVVGGAHLCLHPQTCMHYGRIMKMSSDGKTKSFDAQASGCAMSEAINVLFLQKAKDALRIYAEIVHVKCRFSSSLQDNNTKGQKYGFYRDPKEMADFINTFYQEIQILPQAVEYVEAFGSAEPKADKAELEAIEKVFCNNRKTPLLVGSVISNIGYTDSASGISNITKVLLGYHNGLLAGNLNCDSPRKDLAALQDGRMRILTDHHSFGRSYAAVNGFSMSGVNSHVLLHDHYKAKSLGSQGSEISKELQLQKHSVGSGQGFVEVDVNSHPILHRDFPVDNMRYKTNIPHLIVVSGRQESSVQKILNDLKSRSVDPEEIALLHNIHKTRIFGHLGRGFTLLDSNEKSETICLNERVNYFDDAKRPLWFVYSGMGSQWAGMGAQLMRFPIFAAAIEKCRHVLEPKGVDIVHIITSPDKTIFDNILNSFVGIAAIQIGLTDVLRALEIVPDKIIGHSVGELGCAYADGCFTAEEMILSAYSRGLVSVQTPFIRGSMAAVGIGYKQIFKMCPTEIEVACHNGPDSSTISGPADVIYEFVSQLTAQGIFVKEVPCSNIAYHSRYIAEAGPALLKALSQIITEPKVRSDRWVSTSVPKDKWNDPIAKYSSAEYHTNNLLNPVLFEETSSLIPANAVVVEIAPHGLLQAILLRSLPKSCTLMSLTRRAHRDNAQFLLEAIGKLYIEGYSPQIQVLYPKVEFPVSTGTPMLSHLVEWAYDEEWTVTLFSLPHKIFASTCNYVLSIHDDAHRYLKGHVIEETTLYPFAATLVAVWDTLVMYLGFPKKKISVQFSDVQFHYQPVLHDQKQLRLFITVQKGGLFEVINENIKIATGNITIIETGKDISSEEKLESKAVSLKAENIYELLDARDYNYSEEFRSIHSANLSLTEAYLLWKENWVTLIDGMIQLNALRRGHDSVSQLHFIQKMTIDVETHLKNQTIVDDALVILAKVCDDTNITRCGGVMIENMKFHDLPSMNKELIALKTLTFVPHVSCNEIDEKTALYVFLQILAENVNKPVINIAKIVEYKGQENFENIKEIINDVPGVKINLVQICRKDLIKQTNTNYLHDIDTLLITNLTVDDNIYKILDQVLSRDTLLINKEECLDLSEVHPSPPYSSVCAHTIGSSRLELVSWRPSADRNGILDICGGEYYLPIQENRVKGKELALHATHSIQQCNQKNSEKVHYVGLNKAYVKKILGLAAKENKVAEQLVEYDFSGITERGERVMGVMQEDGNGLVQTIRELLWPIPEYWTLEEAATVPLAYCLAFYCLYFKSRFYRGNSVLVHSGAGALGQAIISIALAHDCDVYTTVSSSKKKMFLLKLFPQLKCKDQIAYSGDCSFKDMVLYKTNKNGCDIVITSAKGDLRDASIACCKALGCVVDTSLIVDNEYYIFGMFNLDKLITYSILQLSSLFHPTNTEDLKKLRLLVSEGIAGGYVRPLSRVVYAAEDAARALRLQAASRHVGRVLLNLTDDLSYVQHKINCTSDRLQLLISDNDILGIHLADRLISRGARNLHLLCTKQSNALLSKLRFWEDRGVKCIVSHNNSRTWKESFINLLNSCTLDNLEGLFCILSSCAESEHYNIFLEHLNLAMQKWNGSLKYFAVVDAGVEQNYTVKLSVYCDQFVHIKLPSLKFNENKEYFSINNAVDAIEQALCCNQRIVTAHRIKKPKGNLLQVLANLANFSVSNNMSQEETLRNMGIDLSKSQIVRAYLRDVYHIFLEEDDVPSITVKELLQLQENSSQTIYTETEGLKTFIYYVHCNELLANENVVFLRTLTSNYTSSFGQFNQTASYLCIIPGIEGLYLRFSELCERLMVSAIVLQPTVDQPHQTITEMAQKYVQILQNTIQLKKRFYLLGYESGVLVALEMAKILEDQGLTGTIFCIGGAPDEVLEEFDKNINKFETEELLQDALAHHMFNLMVDNDNPGDLKLENELKNISTWKEKVSFCVQKLLGRVDHSTQYAKEYIEAVYARLAQVRRYHLEPHPLRSLLISIRPQSFTRDSNSNSLQSYSQQKVVEYELKVPLAYAARDMRCAAIVNRHLDKDLLEEFDNSNLCETYHVTDLNETWCSGDTDINNL